MVKKLVYWFFNASWKIKTVVVILILVAGFFIGKKLFFPDKSGYVFGKVQKQTVTETVSESGSITADGQVSIYSPATGMVEKVLVKNGDTVTENQKLFSVKSTATPQEKSAAYAAYRSAVTAVQQAENARRGTQTTVDRVHDDLKNKSASEDFSEKESRVSAEVANDNAWDALLSARAQLESAQTVYQATQNSTVTTPVAGIISNLSVVKGSAVAVANPLIPSQPVLIVTSLGPSQITIQVGESDINKVKVGQEAQIKLDAVPNQVYSGRVTRFDDHGSITQSVVRFSVYLEIINPDPLLKTGMTADVDITAGQVADTLAVPNSAVRPYQKGRAVRYLDKNGKVGYLPVKIGVRGKEFTQILEGLSDGQEIIVSLANEKAPRAGSFGF